MDEKLLHLLILIREDLHGIRVALASQPNSEMYLEWDRGFNTLDEIQWSIEEAAKKAGEEKED